MKVLPVNVGYYTTKSINNESFLSRKKEVVLEGLSSQVDVLEFEGKKYQVGVGNPDFTEDKTSNEHLKIMLLNMLAKFVPSNKNAESFSVLLCTPPQFYNHQKVELPKYLAGTYDVIWNTRALKITIVEATVYPETYLAYLPNNIDGRFDNKTVNIIDIGGYTRNIARYVNGNPMTSDFHTEPKGMYYIDNAIADLVNSRWGVKGIKLDPDKMNTYRESGYIYKKENLDIMKEEEERIKAIYREYINEAVNICKVKKWDLETEEILVTGGGGTVLYDTIKEIYCHAILGKNPLFDNLDGLSLLAEE